MTTPPATADGLITTSFDSALTPAQVAALLNALVEGAPFAGSLTRAETATGRLAFPVTGPSGWAWLRELEEVPKLVLDDRSSIVSVCKVAGYLPVSAEMMSDSAVNITTWVSNALTGSLSRDLDEGILRGSGAPQPDGVLDQIEGVTGPSLIAATGAALAEIGEAGGQADTIAMSPSAYVAEMTATGSDGALRWPAGIDQFLGLNVVQVPGLDQPLCYDSRLCFLVLGADPQVTIHDDWQHDASILLIKARANVGVPVKDRAIRKLEVAGIGDGGTRASGKADKRG